jgi:Flp pilus assembly protein TadD
MSRRDHLVYIFLLAAITLGVYYPSFDNGFVYDDYPFLVDNPAVKGATLGSIPAYFTDRRSVSSSEDLARDVWRPLMPVSFALDHRLWGLEGRCYHIENAFIHTANAWLVYALTAMITADPFASLVTAAVFAIHPVQTEAVAWVSGRSNLLFLFFLLSAFICHILNRKRSGASPAGNAAALAFFALSLLSKEMAIALPVLLILYDLYFVAGLKARDYARYYLPFFLVSVLYIAARYSVIGTVAQRSSWWGGGPASGIAITLKALAAYVKLAVFPAGLGIEYAPETSAPFAGTHLAGAAMVLVSVAALFRSLRRNRKASFFILWFFASLVPVCNIVPFKAAMAERFMYLPLIGFAGLFGLLFAYVGSTPRLGRTLKAASGIALASVIASYGFVSIARILDWRDEMAFYGAEAARSPTSAKARYNYGYILAKEALASSGPDRERAGALYALAISEYAKAIELNPSSQAAHLGMANAASAVGMYDVAIAHFGKAISISAHADIYNNLGVAYYRKKMYPEALSAFRKALELDPRHVNALVNLGNVYEATGHPDKARRSWMRSLGLGADAVSVAAKIRALKGE